MDFNKSASAPGWNDEKSAMVQTPPPPYQDQHGAQPGQAYPPQGYGYSQQPGAMYNQQLQPMGQQYPGQPCAGQQGPVTIQPTVYVTQSPLENPVNDYMGYSIFTMLCCCLPLGIAALIFSILFPQIQIEMQIHKAKEANHVGDRMSAERNSRTARTLNHVALGLGIGSIILMIIYFAVVFSIAAAN